MLIPVWYFTRTRGVLPRTPLLLYGVVGVPFHTIQRTVKPVSLL
jgi:hypothetical protein